MPKCKHCGSGEVIKAGLRYVGAKKQKWLCKACGRHFFTDYKEES